MNISLLALALDTFGTLLIAFAALRVHHRVLNEHKVDNHVFRSMKREQFAGVLGICFVICGSLLEFYIRSL